MNIEVTPAPVDEVAPLRELHRHEMNCQIVHDSFPGRGFYDPYLIRADGRIAGYGMVANRYDPDTVDEFYVIPGYRAESLPMFWKIIEASKAKRIRAQTNDRLMLLMLYDCATNITTDTILFADAFTTHLPCPEGIFRKSTADDKGRTFEHKDEPVGDWVVDIDGVVAATGGALYHYNPPYGDIYMEVDEPYRRRGIGSYLVQELKRVTYEIGKKPAARCGASNTASRRTMEKAGLLPCGRILVGDAAT